MPNIETARGQEETQPPWSLISVAIISFLLPPGGALLTIKNLHRLHALDRETARSLRIAVLGLCATGYAALLLLTPAYGPGQLVVPDRDNIVGFGIAAASLIVQRKLFVAWRLTHPGAGTSSWIRAIGWALFYAACVSLLSVPLYLVARMVIGGNGGPAL